MKNILKKITVMSITLVLFCVSAVAQNENQTRSTTDESFGVELERDLVILTVDYFDVVGVTLLPGYIEPYLIYEGVRYDVGEMIDADFFSATLVVENDNYSIVILADKELKIADSNYLFVRASVNPDGMARNSIELEGQPILITVYPRLGN